MNDDPASDPPVTEDPIELDGARFTGGGQVLRTALALSLALSRPFRMVNIRAGRPRPGLARQHVECVAAACRLGGIPRPPLEVGQKELVFIPVGPVWPGAHRASVEGAGSTTLMLQTLLMPLALASGPSSLDLGGGTHVPFSPPFEATAHGLLPLLGTLGLPVTPTLERAGYHPPGGGRWSLSITPARPEGWDAMDRGASLTRTAYIVASNLPDHVIGREAEVISNGLGRDWSLVRRRPDAASPGNSVTLIEHFERGLLVSDALGRKGLPAQAVATSAVQVHKRAQAGAATLDAHTTDQILLPLAFARGPSRFLAPEVTDHVLAQAWVLEMFAGRPVVRCAPGDGGVVVEVRPVGGVALTLPRDGHGPRGPADSTKQRC